GDSVKNIYNWMINGNSIAVLNMPFERVNGTSTNNAWDYSGFGNNGSETGAIWNSTGGYDGKGAYEFDGDSDAITIPDTDDLDFNTTTDFFTISFWAKHYCPNHQQCTGSLYDAMLSKGISCDDNYIFYMGGNAIPVFAVYNGSGCGGATIIQGSIWQNDTWVFVAGQYNGTHIIYYENGVKYGSTAMTKVLYANAQPIRIGGSATALNSWNGSIDDVMIFNRTLSSQEILALYNNRTDLIVSQETSAGENWSVEITPNDGSEDGTTLTSNSVTIQNTLPTAPTLILPADNSTTINRTPSLTWNNSNDIDNDNLTYNVVIDDNPTFNNPEVNVSGISETNPVNTTYGVETELDVDATYYWKVRANDSTGYGNFSPTFNFTLESYLAISVIQDTVNFSTISNGDTVNTTAGNATPFLTENVGNIIANVTITATPIFQQASFPSNNYQFKIAENESNAFNLTLSTTDYTNMTNVSSTADVVDLDWHNFKNDFLTHILLRVPVDEGSGTKSSTVTFNIG
ncbi:MAG: LamG domain-containing protein, partial [Nanoarchaeota archaeon]|nr:LamG domain-containing protein [Nanoarchaeota archaeon]